MSKFYESIIRRAMFGLDAETAHEFGIKALRLGLATRVAQRAAAALYSSELFGEIERFGLAFKNPLGVAAGFDKNGIIVNQLAALGFGFVEVGTVTSRPQTGNAKPRLFRLPEDQALINRLGFNNDGAPAVAERLRRLKRTCIVGVNIGKNKDVPNEEAVENYVAAFDLVYPVADYIAVNVSSPNTPNLRELQRGDSLEELLKALQIRNTDLGRSENLSARGRPSPTHEPSDGGTQNTKPVLVKIAPDLDERSIEEIVDVCVRLEVGGIIATNTTLSRRDLQTPEAESFGAGGLSGRPLARRSNEVIRLIYRYSKGKLPIVGVGGIFSPEEAFEKIAAGASLLQAYTGFVYHGPGFACDMNRGLRKLIQDHGFTTLDEAIGSKV